MELFVFILFVFSYVLTYFFRIIALKKSIIDIPNQRSSHSVPTPRGGGLAIGIVWFTGITCLFFADELDTSLFYAFLCGSPLLIIGIIDDIYNVKPYIRFSIQAISAISALYFLGGISSFHLIYFDLEYYWINTFIAFVFIIWFINLFNFVDGIDGYISTGTIVFTIVLFYLTNNYSLLILTASLLGFLIWNWQPAKIFMGDVGSTLLGFNFVIFALFFSKNDDMPFIYSIIISSIFFFDTTYTLIRRFLSKENLSKAHKKHIYQRYVQIGISHKKVVFVSVLLSAIISGVITVIIYNSNFLIPGIIIILISLIIPIIYIEKKKPFKNL